MAKEGPKVPSTRKKRTGNVTNTDLTLGGLGTVAALYTVDGRVNESVNEFVKRIVRSDDDDPTGGGAGGGFGVDGDPKPLDFSNEMVSVALEGLVIFAVSVLVVALVRNSRLSSGSRAAYVQ